MSCKRIFAVFLRQIFLIKGNPTRLISFFIWPLIDVFQWGFISKYLRSFGQPASGFVSVILGAIILWEFMSRLQQGIMTAFLEDIWTQNFINFFASPLKVGEYLSGLILTSVAAGLIGFLMMAVLAGLLFGYNIFIAGFYLLPFMLILFIFGIAMGILVSAVIFRLGPTAEWLGWPIPLVLSIFAGVFYPVATLPGAMQIISRLIPASYVFESFRAILAAGAFFPALVANLLAGAGLSLLYLALTYLFFIRIYGHNLKTGGLARFSAAE
jgi:ABC-2 type transport system permease protein